MPDDALTRERVREALMMGASTLRYCYEDGDSDAKALDALRAALDDPARWCGVVGDVAYAEHDTLRLVERGDLIVTPHQEGA